MSLSRRHKRSAGSEHQHRPIEKKCCMNKSFATNALGKCVLISIYVCMPKLPIEKTKNFTRKADETKKKKEARCIILLRAMASAFTECNTCRRARDLRVKIIHLFPFYQFLNTLSQFIDHIFPSSFSFLSSVLRSCLEIALILRSLRSQVEGTLLDLEMLRWI